jgi:hypothetical protein
MWIISAAILAGCYATFLAMFAAILLASSFVNSFAAERRPGPSSKSVGLKRNSAQPPFVNSADFGDVDLILIGIIAAI